MNTSGVAADTRPDALAKFALKQRHLWDVEYETERRPRHLADAEEATADVSLCAVPSSVLRREGSRPSLALSHWGGLPRAEERRDRSDEDVE